MEKPRQTIYLGGCPLAQQRLDKKQFLVFLKRDEAAPEEGTQGMCPIRLYTEKKEITFEGRN